MDRLSAFLATPLGTALRATVLFALFGLGVRYVWGAFDPEMRGWSLVKVAPVIGVITYLGASGRQALLAKTFIAMGGAALAFWAVVLGTGAVRATTGIEWVMVAVILAFPSVALWYGIVMWRKLRTGRPE